jgi:hypothetical protein
MKTVVLLCWVVCSFAGPAWALDADDHDGGQATDKHAQEQKETIITTPDGGKIYLNRQAGTWRDEKGHRGSLDTP